MDIPENIKEWLYYDEKLGELLIRSDAPNEIKKQWEEWKKSVNDFEEE